RRERFQALNRHFTDFVAGAATDALKAMYGEFPHAVRYLYQVRDDVLANPQYVAAPNRAAIRSMPPFAPGARPSPAAQLPPRYAGNVVVDHSDGSTAPIVYEQHPSLSNLVGRIEHTAQFGALVTDFTMIRPGALHRANGGYLVLDAE